ncbi:MAG: beta-phosphoglucomutase [Candidatus Cohnella colombiensis]|uniref:Beta-phosphoglucomutase n=1 Tax=Candidatus Cohnella colombiensis TaxID=3121368 RepID=A0AA95EZ18_9BACL|nr:MAG: beta-phosphoglucomutase [Cohnella sp.]
MKPFVAPKPIYPLDQWKLIEERFEEQYRQRNETMFALGNGYIGMRGNFEENDAEQRREGVIGTYLNGFYDSEPIIYPEGAYGFAKNSQTMLNVADAKIFQIEIDGQRFGLYSGKVLDYRRELDMRTGELTRFVTWESDSGKQLRIVFRRIVSLNDKHLAAIRCEVTALNFTGQVALYSSINGEVSNQAASDDPRIGASFSGQVLQTESVGAEAGRLWIKQRTKHTGFVLYTSAAHTVEAGVVVLTEHSAVQQLATVKYVMQLKENETVAVVKSIAYYSSRDYSEKELAIKANQLLDEATSIQYSALQKKQIAFLNDFWKHADVQIEGDHALQQGIRYNAYQLLQSTGRDGKTNIGAKGLTGEGYEGHYFWDTETFVLPFFIYTNPKIARALLSYRSGTLDHARARAREMSQLGALYPWRTINGEETSAYYPAGTAQVHINADIIHGLKQYFGASGDEQFLLEHGAEMLFETARFWVDLGYHNERRGGQFCIDAVTGPDEYTAIVNNNVYTNVMAKDHLEFASQTYDWLKEQQHERFTELIEGIKLTPDEPQAWRRAAELMFIPYDEELGIVAQDDTFLQKKRWDFANTPEDRYPLLLHYHPLVIYRHQVLKQADVVLALFLQSHRFSLAEKIRNYNFYEQITTHDSSLSPCIHSIVATEIGYVDKAYEYFMRTVRMDLDDLNGNVADGLHTASMAGSWLSIVNGFAGMRDDGDTLSFKPIVPKGWQGYRFRITYHERLIDIKVTSSAATYRLLEGQPLSIVHRSHELELVVGNDVEVSMDHPLEAVLFDLDGVITDTAEFHYEAWKHIANELKLPFNRELNEQLKGVGRLESLDIILGTAGATLTKEDKQQLATRKNEIYMQLVDQMKPTHLLPGIMDLLQQLKEKGLKLAIASASRNAVTVLNKLQIIDFFDIIVDPDSLQKGKPDPEIFIKAAEQLGVDVESCIAIEDSFSGIAAIKAANMVAIGVGDSDVLKQANVVVSDTEQLTLALLVNSWKA